MFIKIFKLETKYLSKKNQNTQRKKKFLLVHHMVLEFYVMQKMLRNWQNAATVVGYWWQIIFLMKNKTAENQGFF